MLPHAVISDLHSRRKCSHCVMGRMWISTKSSLCLDVAGERGNCNEIKAVHLLCMQYCTQVLLSRFVCAGLQPSGISLQCPLLFLHNLFLFLYCVCICIPVVAWMFCTLLSLLVCKSCTPSCPSSQKTCGNAYLTLRMYR